MVDKYMSWFEFSDTPCFKEEFTGWEWSIQRMEKQELFKHKV
ncbi:hypothetical protein J1TS3_34570 [Siminovitchia fordii]|uniref:Uncharacterized protein n=1 Tax=Siminovitchia fordii TaxID=254759 RepID=A0ABQ4KB28_9BACI|nr:hypothetical protein J1TS3_34570 [Siminovitchia fordii]